MALNDSSQKKNWINAYLFTDVFQQMKHHGKFWAILTTYAVSSMLHGVNIRLAAVLLTLGFATHAEFRIRLRLAEICNACVTAHPCPRDTCRHKYKAHHHYVRLFNLAFSILAIIHLAYLGIMFYDSMDTTPEVPQWHYIFMKWSQLNFLTHLLILITYLFIYCVWFEFNPCSEQNLYIYLFSIKVVTRLLWIVHFSEMPSEMLQ